MEIMLTTIQHSLRIYCMNPECYFSVKNHVSVKTVKVEEESFPRQMENNLNQIFNKIGKKFVCFQAIRRALEFNIWICFTLKYSQKNKKNIMCVRHVLTLHP